MVKYLKRCLILIGALFGSTIAVAQATPAYLTQAMTASEAAYAFRKSGFEASPQLIALWTGSSRIDWINHTINSLSSEPVTEPPNWTRSQVRHWGLEMMEPGQRNQFNTARKNELDQLRGWWVQQMAATESPMAERMVAFWHNTFVASSDALRARTDAIWLQHQAIRKNAVGNYQSLVQSMVRDPALLMYLDNTSNHKNRPNENFAREFLELFTLGVGNYSEDDVKEAARALTGWGVTAYGPLELKLNPAQRDVGKKTILGQKGGFDGDDLVQIILDQPANSRFVATGLWSEFVSHSAPNPEFVDQVSMALTQSDYSIPATLKAVLSSPYFWSPELAGTSVKSPMELVVGLMRSFRTASISADQASNSIDRMGQRLFAPPDVSGWGYGEYWLGPVRLLETQRELLSLAGRLSQPNSLATSNPQMMKTNLPKESVKQEAANGLLTRELVLMGRISNRAGYRAQYRFMFDNLTLGQRNWAYFGFGIGLTEQGDYRLVLYGNQCQPQCLSKWILGSPQQGSFDEAWISFNRSNTDMLADLTPVDRELVMKVLYTAANQLKELGDEQSVFSRADLSFIQSLPERFGVQTQPLIETGNTLGLAMGSMQKTSVQIEVVEGASPIELQAWVRAADRLDQVSETNAWLLGWASSDRLRDPAKILSESAYLLK